MDDREHPTGASGADATQLLQRVRDGDGGAADDLLPLVYAELRARASSYFRHQPADHTLQPTALVHEAFVKMVRNPSEGWDSRAHFCSVAALAMRQILTDHARRRAAAPPTGEEGATMLETPATNAAVDLLTLDDALSKLAELNQRHAKIVELRFFGGLNNAEVANVLDLSRSMIEKEWRKIRAWLARELEGHSGT
ncbi:MAG: ECF-type sigma factor [Planctomycetota bacterium]